MSRRWTIFQFSQATLVWSSGVAFLMLGGCGQDARSEHIEESTITTTDRASPTVVSDQRDLPTPPSSSGSVAVPPVSTSTPTAPGASVASIEETSFVFDDGVSQANTEAVHDGIRIARQYAAEEMDVELRGRVNLFGRNSPANPAAFVARQSLTVNFLNPVWNNTSAVLKRKIVVHEFFHLVQAELTRSSNGPWWIAEGTAEYVGYLAIVKNNLITYEQAKACHIFNVKVRNTPFPSLSEINGSTPGSVYSVAFLAVDRLVGDSPVAVIRQYLQDVSNRGWNDAFESVFHQDMLSFESDFERSLAALPRAPGNSPCP